MQKNSFQFLSCLAVMTMFSLICLGCHKENRANVADASFLPTEEVGNRTEASATEKGAVAEDAIDDTQKGVDDMEKSVAPEEQGNPKKKVFAGSSDGFVNIRMSPSATSTILGRLITGGEGATYLGTSKGWYKVSFKGKVGYVSSKFTFIQTDDRGNYGSSKKVYYVVIGSFEQIHEAIAAYKQLPDALMCSAVFLDDSTGKILFRLCSDCFYSKAKAEESVRNLKQYLGRDAWVWESSGIAVLEWAGTCPNGDEATLTPQ